MAMKKTIVEFASVSCFDCCGLSDANCQIRQCELIILCKITIETIRGCQLARTIVVYSTSTANEIIVYTRLSAEKHPQ